MNDPHVKTLRYRVESSTSHLLFESPPPITDDHDAFQIHLADGMLMVEMKEHFASLAAARNIVEGFLTDWVIHAALDFDRELVRFEYENGELIDRNPSPNLPGQIVGSASLTIPKPIFKGTGTVEPLKMNSYPTPPKRFKATTDVKTMWFRYQQHIQGRETYQSVGYFCLSLMQWSTGIGKGARSAASRMYKIDRDVLDRLGKLTSEKGALTDARKVESSSTLTPLTDEEKRWIRSSVKMLIRRKGEFDYDPTTAGSLKQITMGDLPKL